MPVLGVDLDVSLIGEAIGIMSNLQVEGGVTTRPAAAATVE